MTTSDRKGLLGGHNSPLHPVPGHQQIFWKRLGVWERWAESSHRRHEGKHGQGLRVSPGSGWTRFSRQPRGYPASLPAPLPGPGPQPSISTPQHKHREDFGHPQARPPEESVRKRSRLHRTRSWLQTADLAMGTAPPPTPAPG